MRAASVPLAILAPALAAALALFPLAPVRRVLWFVASAAALAGASVAFWHAYQGHPVAWRSFRGGLLPCTLIVSLHAGALLAGARSATLSRSGERLALVGLAVGATGAAACAFTTGAATLALFLPVPTLGVVAATLAGGRRAILADGLAGLALADVAALAGLWLLAGRTGSSVLGPGGPSSAGWLLLVAAALKAGCVPWAGSWAAGETVPGARLAAVAVRAQGLALAAMVLLTVRPGLDGATLAAVATALTVACGVSALAPGRAPSGLAGIGPAVAGLAIALGGGVGVRAFLLLAPALPLLWAGAAALFAAAEEPPVPARAPDSSGKPGDGLPVDASPAPQPRPPLRTAWTFATLAAAGGVLASLALLPFGGLFPGAWLVLSLAAARAPGDLTWLVPIAAILSAVACGSIGAIRAIRDARPSRLAGPALAIVAASVYAGVASGPLALGWLARVERDVASPRVLPSAGAPFLPPAPALRLVLAAVPALLLAGGLVFLARGVRVPGPMPAPRGLAESPDLPPFGISPRDQIRFVVLRGARLATASARTLRRARERGLGWGITAAAEALAAVVAVRLVLLAAGRGFL